MKKFLVLSMAVALSACATAQDEEVITEPETVTTERVIYRDYDGSRIYQEDMGRRQYADAGRRRIRVVRTTPVEVYEPSYEPTTTIVEDSYQPSYTEHSYSRPRRIMDDDPAPRRIYNRPRYNDNTYISTNSDGRPCRRRSRIVDGYRTVSNGKGCPDEIRETREPVEILYKKTTYKTVYEPKTYTDVTYEKEPYRAGMIEEVVHTQPQPVDTIVETTTTTTTVTD